jgi:hypothetical protein
MIKFLFKNQGGSTVTPVTLRENPNTGTPPVMFLNEISKNIFAKIWRTHV